MCGWVGGGRGWKGERCRGSTIIIPVTLCMKPHHTYIKDIVTTTTELHLFQSPGIQAHEELPPTRGTWYAVLVAGSLEWAFPFLTNDCVTFAAFLFN